MTQDGTSEAASGSGGGAAASMSENSCSSSGDLSPLSKTFDEGVTLTYAFLSTIFQLRLNSSRTVRDDQAHTKGMI